MILGGRSLVIYRRTLVYLENVLEEDPNINNWLSNLPYDHWAPLPVSGLRPSARYKHAAAVADGKLYIVGGSRNGRHLSDVHALDVTKLECFTLKLHAEHNPDKNSVELLPTTSGHSLVTSGSKLYLLGGHSKESSDSFIVRSIDLETHHIQIVKTSGNAPGNL